MNADFKSADACFEEGGAYIFIGSAVWSVIFFTIGVKQLHLISQQEESSPEKASPGNDHGSGGGADDDAATGIEMGTIREDQKLPLPPSMAAATKATKATPPTTMMMPALVPSGSGGARDHGPSLEDFQRLKSQEAELGASAAAAAVTSAEQAASAPGSEQAAPPVGGGSVPLAAMVGGACRCVVRFVAEPLNAALVVGIAIGLTPPLQRALFDPDAGSAARVVGSTVELLGSPVVGLVVLSTGAALANVDLERLQRLGGGSGLHRDEDEDEGSRNGDGDDAGSAEELKVREGSSGSDTTVVARGSPSVHDTRESNSSSSSSSSSSSKGGEIGRRAGGGGGSSSSKNPAWAAAMSIRSIIAGFCLARLVVAPAVIVALFALFPGFRPDSKLAQLITLVSSGMPSAQILVMLLNKLHLEESASQLVFLFVFQYSFSLATTAVVVVVALRLVHGG